MIPEIGHFALVLALAVAIVQGVVPLIGAARGDAAWMAAGRSVVLSATPPHVLETSSELAGQATALPAQIDYPLNVVQAA